jgi:uncharacterized protein YegL
MKENLTEIIVILDASGSMQGFTSDTIGGFNTFLQEQKKLPGEANITITTFNSINPANIIFDGVDIKKCYGLSEANYKADGMTPLYDAIGHTISSVGQRLSLMPEQERPSKVLFMISTDGMENCSRDYTQQKIKNMIEHQKNKYNWEFVFTAANIDTIFVSSGLGIGVNSSASYDQLNTKALYTDTFNIAATSYRATGQVNLKDNK